MRHYGKFGLGMLADYKDDAMETGVQALAFIGSAAVANLVSKKIGGYLDGMKDATWAPYAKQYGVPLVPIALGLALGKQLEKRASGKVAKKAASGVRLGMVAYGVAALVKPFIQPYLSMVPGVGSDLQIPMTSLGELTLLAGDMSVQRYLAGAPATYNRVAGAPASFDRVAGAPSSFRTVNPKFAGLSAARRVAQTFAS